jgi:hypothetical protein
VRAPVAGRVSDRRASLGDYVTAGQTVLTCVVSVDPRSGTIKAVTTDQTRRAGFVLGKDNKVAMRNVELGPMVEGLRVIRSGVKADDKVVFDRLARLQPGTLVNPKAGTIRPRAGNTAPVAVPVAALYPRISLLGTPSLGAARPGDLGNAASFGFSLGPLISWNFPFNGAARAQVRAARADTAASLARFDAAVLGALQETEGALARLSGALAAEARLREAADASREAARLTELRYKAGSDDALRLLQVQRDWRTAEAAFAEAAGARAAAQVSVFRALGGGWETPGEAPPGPDREGLRTAARRAAPCCRAGTAPPGPRRRGSRASAPRT